MRRRKAQYLSEMALLVAIVLAAIVGMQSYVRRGIQARIKHGVDAGGSMVHDAVPDFKSVFQPQDHVVYILLRCMEKCQMPVMDPEGADKFKASGNYTGSDWMSAYLKAEEEKCVQETCIDTRDSLRVSAAQLIANVKAARNDDGTYDYAQVLRDNFNPSGIDAASQYRQYEPYYVESGMTYNMEQVTQDRQAEGVISSRKFFKSSLTSNSTTEFNEGVDARRWK